jgi:hypothetical protein
MVLLLVVLELHQVLVEHQPFTQAVGVVVEVNQQVLILQAVEVAVVVREAHLMLVD